MSVLAFLQTAEDALHCLHGTIPPPPSGGRHRSGGPRGVPGGHSEAVHGRRDPGAADGQRREARPLADDARVCGRPADDGASADRDRALRQLERGQAAGRARAAAVRDAGGAARPAARARRRAGRTPTARDIDARKGRCRRSRSSGTRSARSPRRSAKRASTCRWGRSGWSAPSSKAPTLARSLGRLPKMADWAQARKADESLLTEWQVYRMIDVQPAWAAFQFLVRERLRDEGVDVEPDGSLGS